MEKKRRIKEDTKVTAHVRIEHDKSRTKNRRALERRKACDKRKNALHKTVECTVL
jgi:hypothetical protein